MEWKENKDFCCFKPQDEEGLVARQPCRNLFVLKVSYASTCRILFLNIACVMGRGAIWGTCFHFTCGVCCYCG